MLYFQPCLRLCFLVLILWLGTLSPIFAIDNRPIPANQAFQVSAELTNSQTLTITWQIAKGYHLYRDHFRFTQIAPRKQTLRPVAWPPAIRLPVEILGNPLVYSGQLALKFNISGASSQTLAIDYQGCSDTGFCYPPFEQRIIVNPKNYPFTTVTAPIPITQVQSETHSSFWIPNLTDASIGFALLSFFALGLLLAFTPCVLPMIPILATIIIGQTQDETKRKGKIAFALSLTYVLAMAFTYVTFGLILAWLGANIQSWLQQAWLLLIFGALMVILALVQWDFMKLPIPLSWQHRLHQIQHRQQGGTYIKVAIMGILSTLIVSPCVTPPLIAILAYISQVGNYVLGGAALFILALGMGTPLILVGSFEGKFLPKTGPWLDGVKILLGLLLLIVAGIILNRLLSVTWTMVWWCIVAFLLAWKLWKTPFLTKHILRYVLAGIVALYGLLLLSGVIFNRPSLLGPLASQQVKPTLAFTYISGLGELKQQQLQAKLLNQPILLDFYAKWCLSCQLLDKTTFANPKVIDALSKYRVLRVDMTKQAPNINAILHTYHIVAPPQIFLFNPDGSMFSGTPLVGEITVAQLLAVLNQHQNQTTTCTKNPLLGNSCLPQ